MDIFFTELTLNYLTVTLLAAALPFIALFDLRKGPFQPLRISFAGMSCSVFLLVLLLAWDSLFYQKWSDYSLIFQTVFLAPMAGCFLVFAYCFPRERIKRTWELPVCIIMASTADVSQCEKGVETLSRFHRLMIGPRSKQDLMYTTHPILSQIGD